MCINWIILICHSFHCIADVQCLSIWWCSENKSDHATLVLESGKRENRLRKCQYKHWHTNTGYCTTHQSGSFKLKTCEIYGKWRWKPGKINFKLCCLLHEHKIISWHMKTTGKDPLQLQMRLFKTTWGEATDIRGGKSRKSGLIVLHYCKCY